jgi:hypothetical protein
MQGDQFEATNLYFSGPPISADEPDGHEIARRSGIHLENVSGGILSNNFSSSRIQDALVLCTTMSSSAEGLDEVFGRYIVEIRKPRFFLSRVTTALKQFIQIEKYGMGPIEYADPIAAGMGEIHPLAFVKRPEYAKQREFRFIWFVEQQQPQTLRPLSVSVPSIVSLCRRVR